MTTETTANLDADSITTLDEWTSHPSPDMTHVDALAQSMMDRGWDGGPVLVITDDAMVCAITGTHRVHAARIAGIEVPTLDLTQISDTTLNEVLEQIHAETGIWVDTFDAARVAFAAALPDRGVGEGLDTEDVAWIIDACAAGF